MSWTRDWGSEYYNNDYYRRNRSGYQGFDIWNPSTYFNFYRTTDRPVSRSYSTSYPYDTWSDSIKSIFGFPTQRECRQSCFDAHFSTGRSWANSGYGFPIYFCAITLFSVVTIILCGNPRGPPPSITSF